MVMSNKHFTNKRLKPYTSRLFSGTEQILIRMIVVMTPVQVVSCANQRAPALPATGPPSSTLNGAGNGYWIDGDVVVDKLFRCTMHCNVSFYPIKHT